MKNLKKPPKDKPAKKNKATKTTPNESFELVTLRKQAEIDDQKRKRTKMYFGVHN